MKRYSTIYADPPWDVSAGRTIGRYEIEDGRQIFGVVDDASRPLAYQSMSLDEIADLRVDQVAADDAHLYLWTTNGYLPDAFAIVEEWGFSYSTTLVWAKRVMGGGLGGAFGISTEFLLFCRRGTLPHQRKHEGTWFDFKRPYDERGKPMHSAKPGEFYAVIEQVSPGPYLELFARRNRLGWDAWGDECLSVELPLTT